MNILNKIILGTLLMNFEHLNAQKIITIQPESMIEKSIRPFVFLDTNFNCKIYKDSLYFQTLGKGKILFEDIGITSHISDTSLLDTLINKICEIQKNDTTSRKNIISIRIFECNSQIDRIFLSHDETVFLFKSILPFINDEEIKFILKNYLL